jgi:septin family protein
VFVLISVENESHCDFVKLREMLIRTNMEDMREKTHMRHYELYRKKRLEQVTYSYLNILNSVVIRKHSTVLLPKKSIRLFMDVAIYEVARYMIKQKKMTQQNSCTTQPKQIFTVLLITKPFTLFLELCVRL